MLDLHRRFCQALCRHLCLTMRKLGKMMHGLSWPLVMWPVVSELVDREQCRTQSLMFVTSPEAENREATSRQSPG